MEAREDQENCSKSNVVLSLLVGGPIFIVFVMTKWIDSLIVRLGFRQITLKKKFIVHKTITSKNVLPKGSFVFVLCPFSVVLLLLCEFSL